MDEIMQLCPLISFTVPSGILPIRLIYQAMHYRTISNLNISVLVVNHGISNTIVLERPWFTTESAICM